MKTVPHIKFVLFLLVIFFILSAYTQNAKICFNPDELFYFKSSQNLSDLKNIFAPEFYGDRRFQKPPLFYLAVFVFFKLFGVNWFSARLVSVISACLVLFLTYCLGVRMYGREKAFFASAMLAGSILFFRFGRIVLPEMMFLAFMVGAFYCAYLAFRKANRNFFYLSFLLMAVGSLVKGPISFILPLLSIFIFHHKNKKNFKDIRVPYLAGFFIFLGVSLAWILPGFLLHGEKFVSHIINVELGYRLFHKTAVSFFHYVPIIFAQYLPWSVFVPLVLFSMRKKTRERDFLLQRSFAIIWFLVGFLMYTAIPFKRHHYILSIFPALSLYLVSFIDLSLERIKKLMNGFIVFSLMVYAVTTALVFPHIFIDGADRLSVKLANLLKESAAPVAVSWRLDPQEVQLHIDKGLVVLGSLNFGDREYAELKLPSLLAKREEGKTLFYLMLAGEERDLYFDDFVSHVGNHLKEPVIFSITGKDWRWRKKILFTRFLRGFIRNPGDARDLFEGAFKEDVFLISFRRK